MEIVDIRSGMKVPLWECGMLASALGLTSFLAGRRVGLHR
jgi:hypothetical protein